MVADLYKQWAYQASQDGNYELAAKCWLAVDEFGQAAFRCESRNLDRALNIVVEYQNIFIFLCFLCWCEMYLKVNPVQNSISLKKNRASGNEGRFLSFLMCRI